MDRPETALERISDVRENPLYEGLITLPVEIDRICLIFGVHTFRRSACEKSKTESSSSEY